MKLFDIDAGLLENRPVIKFRGNEYPVADLTVAERIRQTRRRIKRHEDAKERREAALEALEESPDDEALQAEMEEVLEEMQAVQADAVQQLVEGMPRDVALGLTEKEFELIVNAVKRAKQEPLVPAPVREIDEEEEEDEGNGSAEGSEQPD